MNRRFADARDFVDPDQPTRTDWEVIQRSLVDAGWLPRHSSASWPWREWARDGRNLWQTWSELGRDAGTRNDMSQFPYLQRLSKTNSHLRLFFDAGNLGYRLVCADSRTQLRPLVAVLSSHLSRDLGRWWPWFDRLRQLLEELSLRKASIVSCVGTTTHRYLKSIADDEDWTLVDVELPTAGISWLDWLEQTAAGWLASRDEPSGVPLLVSPLLGSVNSASAAAVDRDALLLGLGNEIHLLYLRFGGRLERLMDALASAPQGMSPLYIYTGQSAVPMLLAEQWQKLGAHVVNRDKNESSVMATPIHRREALRDRRPPASVETPTVISDTTRALPRAYLSHWTRAATGPWPDQSEADFVRDLLGHPERRLRSALDVLQRILSMERLLASGRLIRCNTPVVCFTAQPLERFRDRTVYRPHLGRWDFTAFGLCFDRDWLVSQGARQVIYGDEQTWKDLDDGDRAFFQPARRRRSRGREREETWTEECEWRVVGNVDFAGCPADRLWVFVPDRETADFIERRSRWPVLCLAELGEGVTDSGSSATSASGVPTCQQSQSTQSH